MEHDPGDDLLDPVLHQSEDRGHEVGVVAPHHNAGDEYHRKRLDKTETTPALVTPTLFRC